MAHLATALTEEARRGVTESYAAIVHAACAVPGDLTGAVADGPAELCALLTHALTEVCILVFAGCSEAHQLLPGTTATVLIHTNEQHLIQADRANKRGSSMHSKGILGLSCQEGGRKA